MWSLMLLFPEAQKSKNQNQLNSHTAKDDPEWLTLLHFSNTFLSAWRCHTWVTLSKVLLPMVSLISKKSLTGLRGWQGDWKSSSTWNAGTFYQKKQVQPEMQGISI